MKHILLLSVLSMGILSSCSTAFKAGQTPDDVYFSPGRDGGSAKDEEVKKKQTEEYMDYVSSLDDRYLHMKVANRYRWGALDNYSYWYDSRYDFGGYDYYSNFNQCAWNPKWNFGFGYGGRTFPGGSGFGWASPIYTVVFYPIHSYKGEGGSTSGANITAYRNKNYNNTNYGYKDPKTGVFVPSNSNNSFGNLLKRVFSGTSENSSSYDRPARSFNNNNSSNYTAPATSSNAGGTSGGFQSTGSSTSTGRGGRG